MFLSRLIAMTALAALLAAPAAVSAQPPDDMDAHGPPPMMMRGGMPGGGDAPGMVIPLMLHGAQLTPDQRARV